MTNEPSPLKDAIMDAVYVPLERDDMLTPCTLPFMTSSEYGVCDGDGCPVSDETIASALNAVAKIQAEYHKVKKETQKEMTTEPSPRPWHTANFINGIEDAHNGKVAANIRDADAALIVDAVNERDRLRDIVRRLVDSLQGIMDAAEGRGEGVLDAALLREARAAIGEGVER